MSLSTKQLFCSTRGIETLTFPRWSLLDFVWQVLMTWFVYRFTTSWRLWWCCSLLLAGVCCCSLSNLDWLGCSIAGDDNLNFNFLYFSLLMRSDDPVQSNCAKSSWRQDHACTLRHTTARNTVVTVWTTIETLQTTTTLMLPLTNNVSNQSY